MDRPATARVKDNPPLPGDPLSDDDKIFTKIDAAEHHSCGITQANNLRCWGHIRYGPSHAVGFKDVAVATGYTCGLKTSGVAQCWGYDNRGNGQTSPPKNDNGTLNDESDDTDYAFSSISSYKYHLCGIRQDNSEVICWGDDSNGQVSGNKTGDTNYVAFNYAGVAFSQIETSIKHTCGVRQGGADDGEIACWGKDTDSVAINESTVPAAYSSATFSSVNPGS